MYLRPSDVIRIGNIVLTISGLRQYCIYRSLSHIPTLFIQVKGRVAIFHHYFLGSQRDSTTWPIQG